MDRLGQRRDRLLLGFEAVSDESSYVVAAERTQFQLANYGVKKQGGGRKKRKKKGASSGFREIGVSLKAGGTYEQFLRFLNSLERHESFVRVNNFTCSPPRVATVDDEGQETWPLKISLNVSTFRYDSGKKKGKKK